MRDLKQHVFQALKIPVNQQKLLLTGKPLSGKFGVDQCDANIDESAEKPMVSKQSSKKCILYTYLLKEEVRLSGSEKIVSIFFEFHFQQTKNS